MIKDGSVNIGSMANVISFNQKVNAFAKHSVLRYYFSIAAFIGTVVIFLLSQYYDEVEAQELPSMDTMKSEFDNALANTLMISGFAQQCATAAQMANTEVLSECLAALQDFNEHMREFAANNPIVTRADNSYLGQPQFPNTGQPPIP